MKAMLKALLVTAVAGLVIGVVVMCRHAQVAPLWSLALPLGASFVGLFLISYLWRDELARFDSDSSSPICAWVSAGAETDATH